jgi:hypothetical protein
MKQGRGTAGIGLEYVLLLAAVVELSLNRLAVRTLRPRGDEAPPAWHEALDHLGLFSQYFVSTLAAGVLLYMLVKLVRGADRPRPGLAGIPGTVTALLGTLVAALALMSIAGSPGTTESELLEAFFTLTLIAVVIDQLTGRGDIGARIGVVLLAVPLVVHFYPSFVIHFLGDAEAQWDDMPLVVAEYGKWSIVLAALLAPYCFAPRPLIRSATRVAPLAVAVFVGLIGAVVLRKHYEVGMELASKGMGVELGPGAPTHHIALYVMGLGAITWTLISTLGSRHESRRRIGVGIALVVAGGYSFAWPFQYLLGAVGLLTISDAAGTVRAEERTAEPARGFRAPPIGGGVWQRYVAAILAGLRNVDPDCKPSTVTVRGDEKVASTHVVALRRGVAVRLRVDRIDDSILCVDLLCGREPPSGVKPDWTMYAKPDRLLGMRAHDEPPLCEGAAIKTGDQPFDNRFRIRDGGKLTDVLFDEGLRARATALIDGWLALWRDRCLQYRIYPGRGAPLDHPIPITELAFRGESAAPAVDRLLTVIELMVELADRAELSRDRVGSSGDMAVAALGLEDDEPDPAPAEEPSQLDEPPKE